MVNMKGFVPRQVRQMPGNCVEYFVQDIIIKNELNRSESAKEFSRGAVLE